MEPERRLRRLPFDQFQRYQSVRALVDKTHRGEVLRVLDVGGWPGLIHDFLQDHETYVVDEVDTDIKRYIKADGANLPFIEDSFDVVACLDVLEHIEPNKRREFLLELSRVSKGSIILTAPFSDDQVVMAEQLLYDYVSRVFGEFPTLREHLEYGLPELADTKDMLIDAGYIVRSYPSGNIFNWLIMMFLKHYVMAVLDEQNIQEQIDELYNMNFSSKDFGEPSYRHIIVAVKPEEQGIFDELDLIFMAESDPEPISLTHRLQLFSMLVDLLNLQVAHQYQELEIRYHRLEDELQLTKNELSQKQKNLEEISARFDQANRKLELDAQHIENLEKFTAKIQGLFIYRLYRRFMR